MDYTFKYLKYHGVTEIYTMLFVLNLNYLDKLAHRVIGWLTTVLNALVFFHPLYPDMFHSLNMLRNRGKTIHSMLL